MSNGAKVSSVTLFVHNCLTFLVSGQLWLLYKKAVVSFISGSQQSMAKGKSVCEMNYLEKINREFMADEDNKTPKLPPTWYMIVFNNGDFMAIILPVVD